MKTWNLLICICLLSFAVFAQDHPSARPRILGIDHVSYYSTDLDGVKKLYAGTLGLAAADPIETGGSVRYMIGKQWVGYSPAPDPKAVNRLDHVAFATDNIAALRRYLAAQGLKSSQIEGRADHSLSFSTLDPEGYHIEFVERYSAPVSPPATAVSRHMIHTGFVVHQKAAEDHFYQEVLGFRLYWHGSMNPGPDDWFAIQVPDGTDWLEYMLNQPEQMDQQRTGVMNHISLGVADMKQAQAGMESRGWKPHGEEQAEIGKDGKWQLDVFDPDLTRIELMEFKPVQKPCCNDFTLPHPTE
jgi:catechol 2,3-dioxygenase-like lactoylglutathione lyase family enzyme